VDVARKAGKTLRRLLEKTLASWDEAVTE
jgi:hypothetical protein